MLTDLCDNLQRRMLGLVFIEGRSRQRSRPEQPASSSNLIDVEQRTRIGVYGLCVNDGHILLTQLWDRPPESGQWTLPGGGIEFGEHPQETLVREFYEETGLQCDVGPMLDVLSWLIEPSLEGDALHLMQFVYETTARGVPQVIEKNGSTADAQWVKLENARDALHTVPLVDHFLARLL